MSEGKYDAEELLKALKIIMTVANREQTETHNKLDHLSVTLNFDTGTSGVERPVLRQMAALAGDVTV